MATVKSARKPPATEPPPPAQQPPAPAEPRRQTYPGDRIALVVWLGGAGLMAWMLLVDLLRTFFRP